MKEQLNTFEWPHKSEKGIQFVTYFDRLLEKGKIHNGLVLFTLTGFKL